MIPLCDVAIIETLRSMFPDFTVCEGPPETARQVLAYFAQTQEKKNEAGIPGITVWRTSAPLRIKSVPLQAKGLYDGKQTLTPNTKFHRVSHAFVRVNYDLMVWTRAKSDRDACERKLVFWNDYTPLKFTVSGKDPNYQDVTRDFQFAIESSDSTYEWITNEKTGMPILYGMRKTFAVDTNWLTSHFDPTIFQIDVTYKEIIDGEEVVLDIRSTFPAEKNSIIKSTVKPVQQQGQIDTP